MSYSIGEVVPDLPEVAFYGHQLSTERTNEILFACVRLLLDRLSEPAWGAAGLDIIAGIASNDLHFLCNFDPDILDLGAADQSTIRQCLAFFSKRADIDIGVDREGAASRKFREAEHACAVTNEAFRAWSQGRFQFRPCVEGILHAASRKISKTLGPVIGYDSIRPRFGPGATTATPKKNACPLVKVEAGFQCSTNFPSPLLEAIVGAYFCPSVRNDGDEAQVGIHLSRVAFVPKNAKTDRTICTEPVLNGMFQNGLGDWVAARLRRVGIDIKDQSANQRAALYGSISNVSATVDLSNASDSISSGLVNHLFGEDWFNLLMSLSSREGLMDKKILQFEKLSSMGNGFTFPVETLVFWALADAVKEKVCPGSRIRTLVYGDDIVVDSRCIPLLNLVFQAVGFSINMKKSFWDGSFRESCGHDYVLGTNVRPVYQKTALSGADFFRLRNYFQARADYQLSAFFENRIDRTIRIYGPKGYGDGHLHDESPEHLKPNAVGSFTFDSFSFAPKRLEKRIAERYALRVAFRPPRWCAETKTWVPQRQKSYYRDFNPKYEVFVRTLATYTQYTREERCLTLTGSDAARSRGEHVYADRRMPDPQTGDDEDFFVVPGTGSCRRTKIYIFGPT